MKLTRFYDLTEAEMKDAFLHYLVKMKGITVPMTVLGSYATDAVSVVVRGTGVLGMTPLPFIGPRRASDNNQVYKDIRVA